MAREDYQDRRIPVPATQEARYTYFPREQNATPAPGEGGRVRAMARADALFATPLAHWDATGF